MRNLRILLFCFCLILTLSGFAAGQSAVLNIPQPCLEDMQAARRHRSSDIFGKTKNLFKKIFGIKRAIYDYFPPACIQDIILSQTEVLATCPLPKTTTNFCPADKQSIQISVTALNLDNDVLTYNYEVSGGKIVGTGQNVTWNLSDAQPSTYTINACVDNGPGCLNTITKEVKVVACPECK